MAIRFFDMFAGIGGFRSGLEAAGGYECAGYCEIDRYARRAYEMSRPTMDRRKASFSRINFSKARISKSINRVKGER